METIEKAIGERISRLMNAQGYTFKKLSDESGVPARTIQNIVYGEIKEPSLASVAKIARTLRVSIDLLYFGETEDAKRAQLHVLVDRLNAKGVETFSGLIEGAIIMNETKNVGVR